jgi:hypothetical protein
VSRRYDSALHEAGHAVVARKLGVPVRCIGVRSGGRTGYTDTAGCDGSWHDTQRHCLISAAGGAAEHIAYPRRRNHHDLGDSNAMKRLLRPSRLNRNGHDFAWEVFSGQAVTILRAHWPEVKALARTLAKHGVIAYKTVARKDARKPGGWTTRTVTLLGEGAA